MSRKVMILMDIKNNKGMGIIRIFSGNEGHIEISLHEFSDEKLDLILKIDDKLERFSISDKSVIKLENLSTNSRIDALVLYNGKPCLLGSTENEKYKCLNLEKEWENKVKSTSFAKVLEEKSNPQSSPKNETKSDANFVEKSSSKIEEKEEKNPKNKGEKHKENTLKYYRSIKPQLDEMFICFPRDTTLENILPNSQFAKVESPDGTYTIGIIYELDTPSYLVYGIPKDKHSAPPDDIRDICDWLPLSLDDTDGAGYYLIYQDVNNGETIKYAN